MCIQYDLFNDLDYDPLSGQRLPLDGQCQSAFGECFSFAPTPSNNLSSCGESLCIDTSALEPHSIHQRHLDGTFCGTQKICIDGQCTATNITLTAQDGGWSEWSTVGDREIRTGGVKSIAPCFVLRNQYRLLIT
jgi:hypothetical protein